MPHKARSNGELEFDRLLGRSMMRVRQAQRISGRTLAEWVEVTPQHIYAIESGARCSCFLLVKIARVLKIEICELLAESTTHCFLKKSRARAS
jgi:DNA-binding XRE family transcriptional regulator